MDIPQLADLIASLDTLLSKTHQHEDMYQEWFERNEAIFQTLQLSNPIPHPFQVTTATSNTFIPDFLVRNLAGVWNIFELKRPDTSVLKTARGRRVRFYDEFEAYLSQCREYSRFFEEADNRNAVNVRYGIDVQSYVPSIIVAGRDSSVNKRKVHDLLFDRGAKVSLLTYDDLLAALRGVIRLQESHLRNLPGITLSMVLVLNPAPQSQEQYICDFGLSESHDRISIGTRGTESLFVRIRDSNGQCEAKRIPLALIFLGANKLLHLHCEIGFGDNFLFLTVLVNGCCLLHREYDSLKINADPFTYLVMGSDVRGNTPAFFSAVETILYLRTLSFEERVQLQQYLGDTYLYYFSPACTELPLRLGFLGNKFFHFNDHPNFSGSGNQPSSSPAPNHVADVTGPFGWYIADKGVLDSLGRPVVLRDPHKTKSQITPPGVTQTAS